MEFCSKVAEKVDIMLQKEFEKINEIIVFQ